MRLPHPLRDECRSELNVTSVKVDGYDKPYPFITAWPLPERFAMPDVSAAALGHDSLASISSSASLRINQYPIFGHVVGRAFHAMQPTVRALL